MADKFDNFYQAPKSNVDINVSGKDDQIQIWRRASSVAADNRGQATNKCQYSTAPSRKVTLE